MDKNVEEVMKRAVSEMSPQDIVASLGLKPVNAANTRIAPCSPGNSFKAFLSHVLTSLGQCSEC